MILESGNNQINLLSMCLSFICIYYIDQNKFELLKDPIKPTIILIWKIQTHINVCFFMAGRPICFKTGIKRHEQQLL